MKVILVEDVDKLGSIGDEIEVKDGYARNFLIPSKLAIAATAGAIKVLEQKKQKLAKIELKKREEFEKLAEKMNEFSCTINVEAGEDEKLFGSVTSDMIAEQLLAEGMEIDKRKIELEEPIKALGVYTVDIKLHPEVKAQVRVWVVKK